MPEDTGGSGCTEKDEVISEATRHTPLGILPQTRFKWSYSTWVWQGYQSSAQKQRQGEKKQQQHKHTIKVTWQVFVLESVVVLWCSSCYLKIIHALSNIVKIPISRKMKVKKKKALCKNNYKLSVWFHIYGVI